MADLDEKFNRLHLPDYVDDEKEDNYSLVRDGTNFKNQKFQLWKVPGGRWVRMTVLNKLSPNETNPNPWTGNTMCIKLHWGCNCTVYESVKHTVQLGCSDVIAYDAYPWDSTSTHAVVLLTMVGEWTYSGQIFEDINMIATRTSLLDCLKRPGKEVEFNTCSHGNKFFLPPCPRGTRELDFASNFAFTVIAPNIMEKYSTHFPGTLEVRSVKLVTPAELETLLNTTNSPKTDLADKMLELLQEDQIPKTHKIVLPKVNKFGQRRRITQKIGPCTGSFTVSPGEWVCCRGRCFWDNLFREVKEELSLEFDQSLLRLFMKSRNYLKFWIRDKIVFVLLFVPEGVTMEMAMHEGTQMFHIKKNPPSTSTAARATTPLTTPTATLTATSGNPSRSGTPVATPARTSRSGTPVATSARTSGNPSRSGTPVATPARTSRSGNPVATPARTSGNPSRSGNPVATPARTSRSGTPVATPARTSGSGTPVATSARTSGNPSRSGTPVATPTTRKTEWDSD
jgi:hypothetical protein